MGSSEPRITLRILHIQKAVYPVQHVRTRNLSSAIPTAGNDRTTLRIDAQMGAGYGSGGRVMQPSAVLEIKSFSCVVVGQIRVSIQA